MTSTKLCLHAGASEAGLAQVEAVHTPAPTETWFPIPHIDVITQVKAALAVQHLTVTDETYALWGDGLRMFGILAVQNGQAREDYGLIIGLRNSHDQSFPAAGAIGSRVFVCDNLSLSGEVKFARKHTRFIYRDLPAIVGVAMERLVALRGWQDTRIDAYKAATLDQVTVHDFLVRSIDGGVLPASRLTKVLAEYNAPRHEEFQPRTAWSLMNAYTEVAKLAPSAMGSRTLRLHGMLDKLVGVVDPHELSTDVTEADIVAEESEIEVPA
jgi:hypothetical protein